MSNPFIYTSVFAPYFNSFIREKKRRDIKAIQIMWILLEFDRFFNLLKQKDLYIKKEHVDKWASTRKNDGKSTLYHKYSIWSQFCRFMCYLGHECYIPRMPRRYSEADFVPLIFTREQINNIFNTCDSMRMKEHHAKSILFIMPALLRVLYSTGIRISEALSIINKDVDFERHVIILNKTKNGDQRLAPINKSLESVLKEYIKYRNRIPVKKIRDPDSHLFVAPTGKPCARKTVLTRFHAILRDCNIPYIGNHHGPRVHDLRHTCAVHSLIKLTGEGMDIYCCLPILATFMGHKKVHYTEHYVRLTQEMHPEILNMNASVAANIYPVINSKNSSDHGFDN